MWKICGYELYKLYKNKLFLIITVLLLGANLLYAYVYGKNVAEYQEPEGYETSYASFVQEMSQRADKMKTSNLFDDTDSYVYRNLQKTCKDYEKLGQISVKKDNNQGIWMHISYQGSMVFTMMFLGILIYQLIFIEREKNLFLLVKVGRCGRMHTAVGKIMVIILCAALYEMIQSGLEIMYFGYFYGYGDVTRSIQSCSIFRNCTDKLNVAEYLGAGMGARIAVAVFAGIFLYACGMIKKSGISTLVVAGVFLAEQLWCYLRIDVSSKGNWLKCINIFYYWNPKHVWGEYVNLNFCGYPLSRNLCVSVVAAFLAIIMAVIGSLAFVYGYQLRQESAVEILIQRLRKKIGCHPKTTKLIYYELYKVLAQQKKIIVIFALVLFFVGEMKAATAEEYYNDPAIASYHSYMQELQGKINQDTLNYIEEKEIYFEKISEELLSLEHVTSGAAYLRKMELMNDLEMNEQGFYLVQNQVEWLKEQGGNIADKYLIDEKAYLELWEDVKTDILLWFIGSLGALFLVSGVFTADKEKKMEELLCATKNGGRTLNLTKYISGFILSVLVFLLIQFPQIYCYYKIDGFQASAQMLQDMMCLGSGSRLSVRMFVGIVFLVKFFVYMLVSLLIMKISKRIGKEIVTDIILVGIICAIAVLFYYLQLDINILALHLV